MPFLLVIWTFIKPFAFKLLLIGGAVLTVLAVMARLKHAGRMQERAEQAERTAVIKQKQLDAARDAPRGREAVLDRLREKGL
jgi:ABC-type protease/lipase transport system fused ATPase/permease subunit